MTLEKTLKNLRKTKESYFGLKKGTMINTDLLKKGLMVYYVGGHNNYIINFKIIDKKVNLNTSNIKYLNREKNSLEYSDYTPYIFDNNINEKNKIWVIKLCI